MPFTPFHLGPGLLFGLLFLNYIDFPTFLLASVIIDVEPFLVLFFNLQYPLHGFLHSFLGGTLIAFPLAIVMKELRNSFSPLMSFFRFEQKISFKSILSASLFGIYLHLLLGSRLHQDMKLFYPFDFNPILSHGIFKVYFEIYGFCILSFISGVVIYIIKLFTLRSISAHAAERE